MITAHGVNNLEEYQLTAIRYENLKKEIPLEINKKQKYKQV